MDFLLFAKATARPITLAKPKANLAEDRLLSGVVSLVIYKFRVGLQLLGAEGAVEQLFPCVLGSGMPGKHLHLLGTEDATGFVTLG